MPAAMCPAGSSKVLSQGVQVSSTSRSVNDRPKRALARLQMVVGLLWLTFSLALKPVAGPKFREVSYDGFLVGYGVWVFIRGCFRYSLLAPTKESYLEDLENTMMAFITLFSAPLCIFIIIPRANTFYNYKKLMSDCDCNVFDGISVVLSFLATAEFIVSIAVAIYLYKSIHPSACDRTEPPTTKKTEEELNSTSN
eukprot:gene5947-6637_t